MSGEPAPRVDRARSLVTVSATLRLDAFAKGKPPGHHLLTWKGGKAGGKALLVTPVSDARVLSALEKLGAKPGDTLTREAWDRRADADHPAPDAKAQGSELTVRVVLPDGSRRDIADLVEDLDGRGYTWKLAGNRALIPIWRSGCVICLQSCPGAKVANANTTMRDLHLGKSRFRASGLAKKLGEGAKLAVEIGLVKASKPEGTRKAGKQE